MRDRVPTNIPEFDQLIDGGFLPNQNILLAGAPGTGKSIFAAQFISNGIKFHDEPGVYVSQQETKEKFYANMLKFGMDFKKLEEEKKFVFVSQQLTTREMYEANEVIKAVIQIKAKRIVYDSTRIFDTKFPNDNERITLISEYMNGLSVRGIVVLWLTENRYEDRLEFDPIAFLADGIISFRHIISETENVRHISVIKLRGVKHDDRVHPMKITDKGIFVSAEEAI